MPTTNPVPSYDPTDLLFNAQKLDEVVNSASSTYADRLGTARRTLAGLEAEFPNAQANAAAAAASANSAAASAQAAATQADLATTNGAAQVALAAQQVALAEIQADLATTNGGIQVSLATAQADIAQAARVDAEAARDAAMLSSGVYATTAAGLAATVSGRYFSVPSADSAEYLILYLNNAGAAVEVKRYPAAGAVTSIAGRVGAVESSLSGVTMHAFNESLTSALSSSFTILQGTPIGFACTITKVKLRNGTPKSVSIVIATRNADGTFVLAQSVPVTTVAGVNEFDVSITVSAGQYIGVSGLIAIGTDTSIKNQSYIRFGSVLSSTPQSPSSTTSDAQISLSYTTFAVATGAKNSADQIVVLDGRVTSVENRIHGEIFHAFDETKTSTTSTNGAIIIGTPFQRDSILTKVKLRNLTPKSVAIVIATRNADGTFVLSQSFPVTTVAGVNEFDVFIRVIAGQYIGVSGTIALGTDTAVTTEPYIKFTSPISSTPQAPLATLSDAQIALSYATMDVADEIEGLKAGLPSQIGTGVALAKNSSTDNVATPNPLFIADTFGFNQPLHPTVLYFASGFNGYKYVMVQTPYPQSANTIYKDRFECPTIHYSNDSINWTGGALIDDLTPDEITNRDYFSDPELVFNTDLSQLEIWYRITRGTNNPGTDLLRRIINADGTFGARQLLISAAQMATQSLVRSPALIYEGGKYKMWYTGHTGGNVGYAETADPTSFASWTWSAVSLGAGATNCWHLDVVKVGTTYYLFNNTVNFDLELYTSTGHTSFTKSKNILLRTGNSKDFYGNTVYRASGLVVGGVYSLFVSGWNAVSSDAKASIGLMRGDSFENLSVIDGGYKRGDTRIGGNIRLGNTQYIKSMIELDDRGNAIGFDYSTETLFFQRSTGERIKIAS